MTSRHTRDEPRWGWAPVAPTGYEPAGPMGHSTAPAPIPESRNLPPDLDQALRLLVNGAAGTVGYGVRPDPEAVTAARHFTTARLCDWSLPALNDDVALVVTELVTNALRHGVPPYPGLGGTAYPKPATTATGSPPYDGAIQLRLLHGLLHQTPWVLCGIFDGGHQAPLLKEPDYIAETGRGLHLVASFTRRWGWLALPHGKVVWAFFQQP